jgi:DNA-binding response OmpR family regulator
MNKTKLLLVEDDTNLGFLLTEYLEDNGFEVVCCQDGESGLAAWTIGQFQFCILDVMLPKLDGFSVAKQIREKNKSVPIIMLTAKSMKEDKIHGFNLGIDDYITKPFDEEELLCRIKAVLSRSVNNIGVKVESFYNIGSYKFDKTNQALYFKENKRRLTKKETEVLEILCQSKNKITKRDDILFNIWGDNNYFAGRSLDVFITKLRKYLKDDPLVKIDGIPTVGYILSDSAN